MKRYLRYALLVIFACIGAAAVHAAGELTVTGITSNASDGITLTFSQDVRVTHSVFGTKCYDKLVDNNATVKTLNATPSTHGNVVVLTAAYCTFVNGHNMHLELNPECFVTLDGATHLSGETTFDFVMGAGIAAEPITALLVAPSNGTVSSLSNIAVVFDPVITAVENPEGFSIVNEHGHSLPIVNVVIDEETSIKALNVNVEPGFVAFESGTTYSLHIAPGAMRCGSMTNDKELVYGRWYFRPEPLTLVTNPPANRMVESVQTVSISAEGGKVLELAQGRAASDITVTGIMDDKSTVYATGESLMLEPKSGLYVLKLDRTLTPETLQGTTAIYNSVKLNIPAGTFVADGVESEGYQALWILEHPAVMGEVSWTFNPYPGKVEAIGSAVTLEVDDGVYAEEHIINVSMKGENAYLVLDEVAGIRIVDEYTGATIMNFGRSDIRRHDTNSYDLRLDYQIVDDGTYTLIIPASSINLYSDEGRYSEPKHPVHDVEATWIVGTGHTTGLGTADACDGASPAAVGGKPRYRLVIGASSAPAGAPSYDLQGRREAGGLQGAAAKRLRIVGQ